MRTGVIVRIGVSVEQPMSHDGYFAPDSMLRRVISETLVGLSGPRVLLIQAAHPVAFAGFFAHTGALDEPYERLNRTALIMNTVAFGTRSAADRATQRVRAMHTRVRGELDAPAGRFPAGTPYAANDPELLLWILATLADGGAATYRQWVGDLDRDELDRLWLDYRIVGMLFGLRPADMPRDWGEFTDYWDGMLASGDLFVGDQARELAIDIVLHPPLPALARPLVEVVNQITIGSLPPEVRALYGFGWDPVRAAALRASRTYVKHALRPLLPDPLARLPVARNGLPAAQQERAAGMRDRHAA
jgi:uncharacterized protein (DUF2236 family)